MVVLKCYKRRLLNLFSQFLENADKIPKYKAMGYLPKKGKKNPGSDKQLKGVSINFCYSVTLHILQARTNLVVFS